MIKLRHVVLIGFSAMLVAGCGKEERAQAYAQRGQQLYEQGNVVKARLELKNALQVDPKSSQAWLTLGKIEEHDSKWKAALKAYARAAELAPENYEARVRKGRLLVAANSLDEAEAEAKAVLSAIPDDPDALTLRGSVKRHRGNVEAALADAEEALKSRSTDLAALELTARCRLDQGRLTEARDILAKTVEVHPNEPTLRLGLAAIYERLGDAQGVIATLEGLIALQPGQQAHRFRLARFLAAQGRHDSAEQTLRQAVDQAPGDLESVLMLVRFLDEIKGIEAGTAALESMSSARPDDYRLRFALADRYRALKDPDRMEAIYRGVLQEKKEGGYAAMARGRLATLALARGEPETAAAIAAETLEQDPLNGDALLVRSSLAMRNKQPKEAISHLRTLLGQDPGSVPVLRLLAEANLAAGDIALASDALEKAIEEEPTQAETYFHLALLNTRVGDVSGAARAVERLLARSPDNAEAQTVLARLRLAERDFSALKGSAERIVTERPEHALGYYLMGLALQQEGQLEESVEQLETAIRKDPSPAEPRFALARSYLSLKRPEQAEAELGKALAAAPNNVSALLLLADAYRAQGQTAPARAQYEKAIALQPTAPVPYQRLAGLQVGAGDRDAARATLEAGVKATRANPALALALGIMHRQSQDYVAAIAAYELALKGNPNLDAAANDLSMLIADHAADDPPKLAQARELTSRFASSDNASYLDTAGWVAYRSGDYEHAATLLERSQTIDEPTPERLYHLGMTYLALERVQ